MGAIAGAVAGGVAAIALAGLAIFWLQRKRPQTPSAVFGIDDTHQPLTDEVRPSDGVTYVTPFTPGAPPIPMILYVRVSTPRLNACIFSIPSLCTGPERPNHIPLVPRSRSGVHRSASRTAGIQRRHSGRHANFTPTGISRIAHCLILPLNFCWTSPGSGRMASTGFFSPFGRVFSSEVFCGQSESP